MKRNIHKTCCEVCLNEECSSRGKPNRSWDKYNKCTSYKDDQPVEETKETEEDEETTQTYINYSPYWP